MRKNIVSFQKYLQKRGCLKSQFLLDCHEDAKTPSFDFQIYFSLPADLRRLAPQLQRRSTAKAFGDGTQAGLCLRDLVTNNFL